MQVERQETTFCTPVSWAECRTLSLMWMFVLWERGDLSGSWGQGSPNPFINTSLITPESSGLAPGTEQATSLCAPYPNLGSTASPGISTVPVPWVLTQKSRLERMFLKRPPTMAARWMTWVGLCLSNRAFVSELLLEWEILGIQ